ncbi:glycosyltransferase family 4 protein [Halorussus salinus]|uniref:glycosyltransferase family 4 protein n=1 Tax=Halorussus salinus TaxID=1364935 RepID=UPI001091C477|nr:glycosyltransferase family 4 protein [Halorussus salinus]
MTIEQRATTGDESYRVLAGAVQHPTRVHPYRTVFNQRSLEALQEAGAAVDVLSPTPFAPPVGPYSEYGEVPTVESFDEYPVHHPRFLYALPKRFFYHLSGDSLAKRASRYAARTFPEPDVVHAASIYLDGYGLLPYARRRDLPLFVVAHGDVLLNYETFSNAVRDRIAETLDYATEVLCVSEDFAERATRLTDEEKIRLLPIGANPDRFPTERRDEIRASLGIDPETTLVLFCGQFIERKGVGEIIDVLPRLDDDETELACIAHTGDLKADLERALAESPVAGRLLESVPTPELREWFAAADLLLLPSYGEGRPTVIYEAMASETAVLGSTAGGIPEQVADGETGLLVPPGDADALERALAELVGDRNRLRRMGERGHRRLLEEGWTWEQHAEQLRQVHREAIPQTQT